MYVKYLLNSVAIMATRFLHWVCGRSLTQQPPNGLTIKPWKKKILKKKKKKKTYLYIPTVGICTTLTS